MTVTDIQTVGVVGLGYVGLPLAVAFAEAGLDVIGIETEPGRVSALKERESYIEGVSSERLGELSESGRLRFTPDYAALGEAGAVVICLPTPLDEHREPDLSALVSGARGVADNLRSGALVVLESTTYPGTTREVLLPMLEGEDGSRTVGRDFCLAFSPERADPGNRRYTLSNIPKVIGGVTEECTRRAAGLYATVVAETHPVSTPESAEMSKLLENIFRGVNIALVNELAVLCERMGIDVWEVVEAAETKPFGFMPFYPGPGLGGHCIPVDPFYLSWRARSFDMTTEFIELAGRINVGMPHYVVSRISAALNAHKKALNGSRVLLLGVSYKPNVGDLRESPALTILQSLRESGAETVYHDPYIPSLPEWGLSTVDLTSKEIRAADCTVIVTDHQTVDLGHVLDNAVNVVDLRNAVRKRLGGKLPANVEVL